MNIDKSLSQIFEIEPIAEKKTETILSDSNKFNESLESDYDTARNNLHCILSSGKEALEHAIRVATDSEHPRAFEVVGNLMKQLADINTQLLGIHEKKKKLDAPNATEESKNVTNNSLFVGSTTELYKMLNDMRKD